MKVLLISPYHGGSHQAWAEGFRRSSSHSVELLHLPARFWKWRMHGGAVTLARRFDASNSAVDIILATDMLDLTTFLALTRQHSSSIPVALYMHENQLTYPLPEDITTGPMRRQMGERDRHYFFINYVSMLAADAIFFNSQYHLESVYHELPNFLKHFPEYNELGTIASLRRKSSVLPIGVDFSRFGSSKLTEDDEVGRPSQPPLVLWNQRWEYDKNPAEFFTALYAVQEMGLPFRLALCGEQFGKHPPAFDEALDRLAGHLVHVGHASPTQYRDILWQADITISTAIHEFFGISMLEAIYCRTFPILPDRLSYPELLPKSFHKNSLYTDRQELVETLVWALTHRKEAAAAANLMAGSVAAYDWSRLAKRYDIELEGLAVRLN